MLSTFNVSDADDLDARAIVSIQNFLPGDALLLDGGPGPSGAVVTATNVTIPVLPLADLQAVVRRIQFINTAQFTQDLTR